MLNFPGRRPLVEPALAAFGIDELLDGVRDIAAGAVDARLLERIVQQLSGRPDKRTAGEILGVAGLFTDERDGRVVRSLAGHDAAGSLDWGITGQQRRIHGAQRIECWFVVDL